MKSKAVYLILAAILAFGVFSRLYRLPSNFIFGNDQAEDIAKLQQMYGSIQNGHFSELPLIGEPGTYLVKERGIINSPYPVYSGVFYLYFLLPFAAAVSFNPVSLVIIFALFNALAIFGIYLAGKELFDEKTGLAAALLFSASYYMNVFSRAIWTPSLIPVFVVFLIYLLILIKKKGREGLWPIYLFLLSAMSQTHNSGYFYAFLFILITFVLRPGLPKKLYIRVLSVAAFILPIAPTIFYEFETKFKLFPRIAGAFLSQLNAAGMGGDKVSGFFRIFWEFWASTINPLQFDTFFTEKFGHLDILILGIFTFFAALSAILVFFSKKTDPGIKKMFLTYLIVIFPLPLFVKAYYEDPFPGIYALSGTSFSVIGAMPFLILMSAFALVFLWEKGKLGKILSLIFLSSYLIINIFFTKYQIWQNNDEKYDYGTKIAVIKSIGDDSRGKKLNLLFDDTKDEGVEFVYLLKYKGYLPPLTYNGTKSIVSFFDTYSFTDGKSDLAYLIAGSATWKKYDGDKKWSKISEFGRFRVYRSGLP